MVKKDILGVDPKEVVLHAIRRHPIGLFAIYGTGGLLFAILLAAVFMTAGSGDNTSGLSDTMLAMVAFAFAMLILLGTYIASSIYRANELIITNESLLQILQQGIFDRKVSQLNLSKVQDVTVDQEGILSTLLGYGTLNVETAGEASNYRFPYTRNPSITAKHIIEAHEQYLRTHQIDSQAAVNSQFGRNRHDGV